MFVPSCDTVELISRFCVPRMKNVPVPPVFNCRPPANVVPPELESVVELVKVVALPSFATWPLKVKAVDPPMAKFVPLPRLPITTAFGSVTGPPRASNWTGPPPAPASKIVKVPVPKALLLPTAMYEPGAFTSRNVVPPVYVAVSRQQQRVSRVGGIDAQDQRARSGAAADHAIKGDRVRPRRRRKQFAASATQCERTARPEIIARARRQVHLKDAAIRGGKIGRVTQGGRGQNIERTAIHRRRAGVGVHPVHLDQSRARLRNANRS